MKLKWIVTLFASVIASGMVPMTGLAQTQATPGDDVLVEMAQASKRGDARRLAALLPRTREHPLHAQAAYWELRNRLDTASAVEVRDFLQRFAGQYHEDRLRNDWLLQLGRERDWGNFRQEYPRYRMNDDKEVRCYALHLQIQDGDPAQKAQAGREALSLWLAQRDADDGCDLVVNGLHQAGLVQTSLIWQKARQAIEAGRVRAARLAVEIVAPAMATHVDDLHKNPGRYLKRHASSTTPAATELVNLAIIRLASSDVQEAAEYVRRSPLQGTARNWLWAVVGKAAHFKTSPFAPEYMRQAQNAGLNDDLLGWKARVLLRSSLWTDVLSAIDAMTDAARAEPVWVYWRARALAVSSVPTDRAQARALLESIASMRGFYEQLAMEELGRPLVLPEAPPAPTVQEMAQARSNPGLQRALHAVAIGLRSEGVREWNYTTNLHQRGGMTDRELLAAAQLACEAQVWDRCINSSERTRGMFDVRQRFPMPLSDLVVPRSREIGLDPAYVYGLIRQESRFIMDARSHVGASGLMQVMPATARWTARKIGLAHYSRDMINDRDVNVQIGTGYLKLVLDDFQGSMPLAAAAYNAGPSRSRAWRNGPVLEGAIWAEGVPFSETRDYVKKVLANTVVYATLLSGQPQSLKKRLGTVGPRDSTAPEENRDLP